MFAQQFLKFYALKSYKVLIFAISNLHAPS